MKLEEILNLAKQHKAEEKLEQKAKEDKEHEERCLYEKSAMSKLSSLCSAVFPQDPFELPKRRRYLRSLGNEGHDLLFAEIRNAYAGGNWYAVLKEPDMKNLLIYGYGQRSGDLEFIGAANSNSDLLAIYLKILP